MKKLQSYSYNGNGIIDCHFYGYTDKVDKISVYICLVNDCNKTVSPVHGYSKPNKAYKCISRLAKKLGYILID